MLADVEVVQQAPRLRDLRPHDGAIVMGLSVGAASMKRRQ